MEQVSSLTFAERYKAILEAFGMLPADLAKRMNEPVAKFYKYQNGVEPRPAFILRMVKALPGLSEDYALRGIGEIKLSPQAAMAASSSPNPPVAPQLAISNEDMEELIRLRAESVKDKVLIQELRQQLSELKQESKEKDREWRDWAKEGFYESDSHNHRFQALIRESYRIEGLKRYDVLAQGKVVRLHPAVKRFTLNSRQPVAKQA